MYTPAIALVLLALAEFPTIVSAAVAIPSIPIFTPPVRYILLPPTSVPSNSTDSTSATKSVSEVPNTTIESTARSTPFTPPPIPPTKSTTFPRTTAVITPRSTPLTTTVVPSRTTPIHDATIKTESASEGSDKGTAITSTTLSLSAPVQTGGALAEVQGKHPVKVIVALLGAAALFFVFA